MNDPVFHQLQAAYDAALPDWYDENPNVEFRAAHDAGVCPECGFSDGLHNEGACSQWRDHEPDEWTRTRNAPIPSDPARPLDYHVTFERALRGG